MHKWIHSKISTNNILPQLRMYIMQLLFHVMHIGHPYSLFTHVSFRLNETSTLFLITPRIVSKPKLSKNKFELPALHLSV